MVIFTKSTTEDAFGPNVHALHIQVVWQTHKCTVDQWLYHKFVTNIKRRVAKRPNVSVLIFHPDESPVRDDPSPQKDMWHSDLTRQFTALRFLRRRLSHYCQTGRRSSLLLPNGRDIPSRHWRTLTRKLCRCASSNMSLKTSTKWNTRTAQREIQNYPRHSSRVRHIKSKISTERNKRHDVPYRKWRKRAGTYQGCTVVVTLIVFATLGYVLRMLEKHQKELRRI